ncbi:MAG: hypothetical protein R3E68_16895 [Burkholderiaceae bacterium]
MIVGLSIAILMLARLLTRVKTASPEHATTGNALLDKLGRIVHVALYLAVFIMAGQRHRHRLSGRSAEHRLLGSGLSLPADFSHLLPRFSVHGLMAKLLLALIALHVLGALFHQLGRKTGCCRGCGSGRAATRSGVGGLGAIDPDSRSDRRSAP